MSSLKIEKGKISKVIKVPGSKSYINRALICGAMKHEAVTITNMNYCDDVVFLINALKNIGLEILEYESSVEIINSFPLCEKNDCVIDIGDGGTTLRFLLPLLALGKKKYELKLSSQLSNRPHGPLLNALTELGVSCVQIRDSIFVKGSIQKDVVTIDASLSSQFASAFTLLKVARPGFKVKVKNLQSSQSYLRMTEEIVRQFSIKNSYEIDGDFSSAAFAIVFSLVSNDNLRLLGMKKDPYQADSKILNLMTSIGVDYKIDESGLNINSHGFKKLKKFSQDISDCLDLAPALSFLASFCDGECILKNVESLKYKESNRLQEIQNLLNHFKIEHSLEANNLIIKGPVSNEYESKLETSFDHRMVMTGALFLRFLNGGEISQVEAVNKSYPNFFKDLFFNE